MATLPEPITEPVDVVIHCGDLSDGGELESYQNTVELLSSIRAPLKLVIPGNHDLSLDEEYWSKNCTAQGSLIPSEAKEVWTGKEAQEARIRLLENGTHEFDLENGGKLTVYANSATPISSMSSDWAFGYKTNEDMYNPKGKGVSYATSISTPQTELQDDAHVDIMMMHGPPKYELDTTSKRDSIGCDHLFRAIRRVRPKIHAFDHVHNSYGAARISWKEQGPLPEDDLGIDDGISARNVVEGNTVNGVQLVDSLGSLRGIVRGMETLVVNAALMGDNGEVERVPWLVEIDLPLTK